MKVSGEMKNVVRRKVKQKMDAEYAAENEALFAICDRLNKEIQESPEVKAVVDAIKKLQALVEKTAKDNPGMRAAYRYIPAGNYAARGYIPAVDYATRVYIDRKPNGADRREKEEDMIDSIIMKLTYGKDFDDAKAILAEYGIEI